MALEVGIPYPETPVVVAFVVDLMTGNVRTPQRAMVVLHVFHHHLVTNNEVCYSFQFSPVDLLVHFFLSISEHDFFFFLKKTIIVSFPPCLLC